jgi:uncharacterized pyridoxamine 5'-phosphate oxidase family protein
MNKVTEALKNSGTFFVATMDGDQARVRPFGAVVEIAGKTYICTNNTKECFKQILNNPKVEISGMIGKDWYRVTGTLKVDPSLDSKKAFLEECPLPMYKYDDGIFEVLYFENAVVKFESFTKDPETFEI